MSEKKLYHINKAANLSRTLTFVQDIPGCLVKTSMRINEDGNINIFSPDVASSPLAQAICAYHASLSQGYNKTKKILIKQLQKAYDEEDYCLSFFQTLSELDTTITADIKTLYNKAVRAQQNEIDVLQKQIDNLPLKRYKRKHLNVAIAQRSRLEDFLREEAMAIHTIWGIFKPSRAKVEQYVKDNIGSLLRKVNSELEDVFAFNEMVESQRELQMNQIYQEEYEVQIEALRNKKLALEETPVKFETFLAEDRKACNQAIEEKLLSDGCVNWPMSFSMEYTYDQNTKGLSFRLALPSKSKVSFMKKFYKMNFNEIEVYRKQEEMLDVNYTQAIIGLAVGIAKLTFNAHKYVENITFCAYNETMSKGWYKCTIHREAIADYAIAKGLTNLVNNNIQLIGLMDKGCLRPMSVSTFENLSLLDASKRVHLSDVITLESENMLGTSAADLTNISTPYLNKYLEWLAKQGDVMTMRGVKVVGYDMVQVTAAFMTRRYNYVMGYTHSRAAYAGITQILKKSELETLEFKRNVTAYLSKVSVDCAKDIKKAHNYETEQNWKMAIKYYERCVECGCEESYPYERLIELYTIIGDTYNVKRIENLKP